MQLSKAFFSVRLNSHLMRIDLDQEIQSNYCLSHLINGTSIADYQSYCKFTCEKRKEMSWKFVKSSIWQYQGPVMEVLVISPNKSNLSQLTQIKLSVGGFGIISRIPLSCQQKIQFPNGKQIIPLTQCVNIPQIQLHNLISAFHIKYEDLLIPPMAALLPFSVTLSNNSIQELNPKWIIRNYSYLDALLNPPSESAPEIHWTSPITSWWTMTWYIIIGIIIIIFIGYIYYKLRPSSLSFLGIATQVPSVGANPIGYAAISGINDGIIILLLLILFWILIRMIKRIMIKFKCHHFQVTGLPYQIGHHMDLIIPLDGKSLIISIKQVSLGTSMFTPTQLPVNVVLTSFKGGTMITISDSGNFRDVIGCLESGNGIYYLSTTLSTYSGLGYLVICN
nr:TPA_asm: glycoprotein [Grylloblatta bifratrilecta mononega-like virus]